MKAPEGRGSLGDVGWAGSRSLKDNIQSAEMPLQKFELMLAMSVNNHDSLPLYSTQFDDTDNFVSI